MKFMNFDYEQSHWNLSSTPLKQIQERWWLDVVANWAHKQDHGCAVLEHSGISGLTHSWTKQTGIKLDLKFQTDKE